MSGFVIGFLFPGLAGEFHWLRGWPGHLQFPGCFGLYTLFALFGVLAPRFHFGLETVIFRFGAVAGFHVEQGEVRMDELLARAQFFGLMAFGNGRGKVAFAIKAHSQGELRVEMLRLLRQNGLQFPDGAVKFAAAEIEHGIVVLLSRHNRTVKCQFLIGECRMKFGLAFLTE